MVEDNMEMKDENENLEHLDEKSCYQNPEQDLDHQNENQPKGLSLINFSLTKKEEQKED